MKNYTVYFTIYGKKLKATELADSKEDAIKKVEDSLRIIEVRPTPNDTFNECVEILDNISYVIDPIGNRKK